MENLSYPIGKFIKPELIDEKIIKQWISDIELFPDRIVEVISGLSDNELDLQYRTGGWTIKQVVHHCADSHMNSFIRFKLALTEESPMIRPYREDKWAELADTTQVNIGQSLKILDGLHNRWVRLLRSLTTIDLAKCYVHPDEEFAIPIAEGIGLYAWHSNHHLAHIKQALERNKYSK